MVVLEATTDRYFCEDPYQVYRTESVKSDSLIDVDVNVVWIHSSDSY